MQNFGKKLYILARKALLHDTKTLEYILVKAPLRVLYNKIHHSGWGRVANTARGEAE